MADLGRFLHPIWLWGTTGVMTQAVLARLLAAQIPLAGLVIADQGAPAPRPLHPPAAAPGELTVVDAFVQPNAVHMAWSHALPVYALGKLSTPEVTAWLAAQAPALVAVACFPRRIPAPLLAIPKAGFLNVHPSRLPAYRGPAPLFRQLRDDVQPLGVTVHAMDADLDTGDILGQAAVPRPDGASGPELDAALGATGGDLLVEVLAAGLSSRSAQPPGGTYQGWPSAADFTLDPAWSARRAYNFVCATAEWGRPYSVHMVDQSWRVDRVLRWDATTILPAPVVVQGDRLSIQFCPGVVHALGVLLESGANL